MKPVYLTQKNIKDIIELEKYHAPKPPYYSPYDEKALKYLFENPDKCKAYGFFEANKLIGWGAFRTDWGKHKKEKSISEISSIIISKKHRLKGLGSKMLNQIIADIKKRNAQRAFLTVSPLNTGALILYLKFGFKIYDFRKDVYGPGSDRAYLQLKLNQSKA